jgi:pSer/pThr/pTyr-binding forkhead associated (FHA) protein
MSDHTDQDHLANLSDGAGCAEVWEHLSEQRAEAAEDTEDDESSSTDETTDADADAETDTETNEARTADSKVPCR